MREWVADRPHALRLLGLSLALAVAGSIPFTAVDGILQPVTRAAFLVAAFAVLVQAGLTAGVSVTASMRCFPIPLALFLLWCAATTLWSLSPFISAARSGEAVFTYLYLHAFTFVLASAAGSIKKCARVIAVAFTAVVAFGLLVNVLMFGNPFHYWLNPDVPDRPRFTFGYLHPLATGDILAICMLCIVTSGWRLWISMIWLAGLFALLLASDSTGARFAVLALLPLAYLLSIKHQTQLAWNLALGFSAAVLLLIGAAYWDWLELLNWNSPEASRLMTLTGRVKIWSVIFENGLATTPFGYGFEAARLVIGPLVGRAYHSHNLYLNILVENGVIGFMLFAILVGSWVTRLARLGSSFPVLLCAYALLLGMSNPGLFTKQTMMLVFTLSYMLPSFYPRQLQTVAPPKAALRNAVA